MHDEPIDSDVDLRVDEQPSDRVRRLTLPAIAVGGMVGACARHGMEVLWPVSVGGFPWATFLTNLSGCLLIGVLMVIVQEIAIAHPLVRPFLGVGLIGGFTTFSTFAMQVHLLTEGSNPSTGLAYLFGTLMAGFVSVALGLTLARLVAHRTWRRPDTLTYEPGSVR